MRLGPKKWMNGKSQMNLQLNNNNPERFWHFNGMNTFSFLMQLPSVCEQNVGNFKENNNLFMTNTWCDRSVFGAIFDLNGQEYFFWIRQIQFKWNQIRIILWQITSHHIILTFRFIFFLFLFIWHWHFYLHFFSIWAICHCVLAGRSRKSWFQSFSFNKLQNSAFVPSFINVIVKGVRIYIKCNARTIFSLCRLSK